VKHTFEGWLYNFGTDILNKLKIPANINSVDQFIITLPDGVYSTLRTVHKFNVFQLSFHLNRLKESLILSGKEITFSLQKIKKPLFEIIKSYPAEEIRIRLFIPFEKYQNCYILLEELTVPSQKAYLEGVHVNTNHLERINPKAKVTSFIKNSEEIKKYCRAHRLEESIILNHDNELLEGISSNFYAVKSGIVYTADNDVLSGATREIILEEIKKALIKISFSQFRYSQINEMDEAFISSTSRGVLPVVMIDDKTIGTGKPGSITKYLMEQVNMRMQIESEALT